MGTWDRAIMIFPAGFFQSFALNAIHISIGGNASSNMVSHILQYLRHPIAYYFLTIRERTVVVASLPKCILTIVQA